MFKMLMPMTVAALVAVVSTSAFAVKVGDQAPDFALKDQDGKEVKLSDLKGKVVVLEWNNPGCPYCKRHLDAKTFTKLHEKYADKDVVYLAINSTGKGQDEMKKIADEYSLKYPVLADTDHAVARAYDAKATPHMFVIDKEGKVAYSGAIDDDQDGKKEESSRVNYVDQAVTEVLDGKAVTTAETKAYGCPVRK